MAPFDKELEEQIAVAGNKLIEPPSSLEELLRLLDQVESSLSKVEQSPAKSMHDALSPLMKALVANDLLRHSDVDVKVAVASCISEITRITAPDAPYDDDKMKDIFQLIVSSFENLDDQSSRSYNKRVMILETVSKVRSCVVMLDLECDGLIAEMFQHFLKAIREDHSENVFSSMATIMTLVLEESEEVSLELLTPLLASVKKDNAEVTPVAKRLGETVFANCAAKLKPYLPQAVESLQISLNEYNKIVTSVLEGTLPAVDGINDGAPKDELVTEVKLAELPEAAQATQDGGSKVGPASSGEAVQTAESGRDEACLEDIEPAVNGSPKSITSNGGSLENVRLTSETESLMKAGAHDEVDLHDASKIPSESDDSRVEKSTKSEPKSMKAEPKSEQPSKKRGRKTVSSINSAESSHQAPEGSGKEIEKLQDHQNDQNKDDHSSASEDPVVEQSNLLEKEPETNQHSAPKESEEEVVDVTPPSQGQSLPEEIALKKGDLPMEDNSNQDGESKKEIEAGSDLEVKQVRRPLKKTPLEPCRKEKGGSTSDTEAKKLKQSGKKVDTKNKSQVGPSARNKEDSKKRGHGKASQETVPSQESPDRSVKHDEDNEEEIPRTTTKRKRSSSKGRGSRQVVQKSVPTPESPDNSTKHISDEDETDTSAKKKPSSGNDRVTETVQCDKSLVGRKIRVWWPLDELFYEGTVSNYDSSRKKFTVDYTDGETEKLNLLKERWELVEDDNMSEEEQVASADAAASESHKKKKPRNAEPSLKHEMDASPKSKSKEATAKSGQKSKGKLNLKDGTSKSAGKADDTTSSKSAAPSKRSTGKSVDTEKPSARSKDVSSSTPKSKSRQDTPSTTANKSKQETVKAANKSKTKTPQSGGKSGANGSEKLKSSSSKVKESGNQKEKATNSAKTPDGSTKEKLSSASKERQSEPKSGKKRARGKN
ncbi:hypothetical protein EJD97_023576 [Solanum chilense]|uniref:Tudor domain-containing protein n=1 Tax=Solanum chilense TaxID=4083 RepID=A0A6N2CK85_SOLCI|nr:hypothetical protein EJD97_023576 [Solanum chilense]